jgi:TolB-like protein/Flp pilus assembly protein TadD
MPGGPGTPTAPRLSLVVLPFSNLSGDPAQEYFADGITEDLTTDLSRLPGSLVIARNSAFTYKDKAVDPKQVGRELGVRYILEGSVRRIGDEVRVNAQLIDAETGAHLWADRFDSDLAELGRLQDEITGRIASSLNVELIEAESRRSLRERPDNPDAVDLTMRGLAVWWRPRSKENNRQARALFEQTLRLDPQYADALAGLAVTHATDVGNGFSEAPQDQLRQAEEAAARALAIDPNHAMAHWARGIVLMLQTRFETAAQQGKFEEAILAYKAALAANPNFALPRLLIASCLNKLGRFEEALATAREGMRVSPRDPQLNQFYIQASEAALALGRYEDAIEWARKSVDAHPGFVWGYVYLASAYALNGQLTEARTALAAANRLRPGITITDFRRDWIEPSDNAAWVAFLERMVGGLREAGMPEGEPGPAN